MPVATETQAELKLVGVARASLEELLLDYQDYLRQHGLTLWGKDHPRAKQTRALCYKKDRSYIENAPPEVAANTLVCLVHQTNYLLNRQLRVLEKAFVEESGFTERLYRTRTQARRKKP